MVPQSVQIVYLSLFKVYLSLKYFFFLKELFL